jgi:putative endonuclease
METFVYIIQSQFDGSYYIGTSANPQERLMKHNRPHKGYTARKQPWKLVLKTAFENKSEALKYEKFLKKQKSKVFIENLILRNQLKNSLAENKTSSSSEG